MATQHSRVDTTASTRSDTGHPSTLTIVDWLALVLMIVGGINWGLIGAFDFDLVASLFGVLSPLSRIVYILVGIAALYGIVLAIRLGKRR